VFLTFAKGF